MGKSKLNITSPELTPIQKSTRIGLKRSTDCYQRVMLKHKGISVFHSRAELYFATQLEANSKVSTYVPQPFHLRIGKTPYTPDIYFVESGERKVVELKPNAKFCEKKKRALEDFFQNRGMKFAVESNESVLSKSVLSENWLYIISLLVTSKDHDTMALEDQLIDRIQLGEIKLGDWVDSGDPLGGQLYQAACFKLLHRGVLSANLDKDRISYNTEFTLCE